MKEIKLRNKQKYYSYKYETLFNSFKLRKDG